MTNHHEGAQYVLFIVCVVMGPLVMGTLLLVDLATGRTFEQGRVHKIAYYPHISYKLSQFNTVYTQNVLGLSVISNYGYPPAGGP